MFLIIAFATGGICKENRIITVGSMNWEPFFGESLPEGGFFTEITRTAFQRVGYDLIVEFHPWKRSLEMAKRGRFHGLLGAYYNEERTHYFIYPDSIYDNEEVFFCRKDAQISFTSFEELSKYRIGVLRGSAIIETLKKANLQLDEVTDDEMNLKKLVANRIDLFPVGKVFMLNLIQTKHPDLKNAVKTLKPPVANQKMYCTISKKIPDHEKIAADFNRGLKMIKNDGTFEKILKKHGFGKTE